MMKRTIDISFVIIVAPFLLIIVGALSLILFILYRRPVFFIQIRPGLQGKPFRLIKFRTMTNSMDKKGSLLPDEKRITRFGKFLRDTSLDELPSFLNVLKGDMSLVGPRPLLMQYLERYTPEQMRRHEAKPGITGWAQINGRNAMTWERKFELDVWYVDHQSLLFDMQILTKTIWKTIKRESINQPGMATMSEFRGGRIDSEKRDHEGGH